MAAGRLDRFGFVDPASGGRVRTGLLGTYYRKEWRGARVLKVDGFVARSLFDLFSNFTFFLNDPLFGDEIQQHDSRLQQGANAQYLHPYKLFGRPALLTVGGNLHANQINVGLYPAINRNPNRLARNQALGLDNPNVLLTSAHARITNVAGYVQQGVDLMQGHLHVDAGLRYDFFRFTVADQINPTSSGTRAATRLQPKFSASYLPSHNFPATFFFNYGRGIASQDARGVVQQPDAPPISTTDFYQLGTVHRFKRVALSTDLFLLDRSNEQVYIPDDGTFEFKGPTRADGFELKTSVQLTRTLAFNGGVTRVMNAFYRGTSPRVYIDSAPHTVANAGFTLTDWHDFTASLRYRHTSNYRLDGTDATTRATGLDVVDFSLSRRLNRAVELSLALDNLTNKRYFETQNYFESRLRPDAPLVARIHGTPGYPFTATAGVTFRFFGK